MATLDVVAAQPDAGTRLDAFVAAHERRLSRNAASHLIADGQIRLNGSASKPSARVAVGDRVSGTIDLGPSLHARPERIALHIVYEDDDLAVIDKPAGMVVHPAAGHEGGTLANALVERYPGIRQGNDDVRPGIVHRLDKDTSGLLVVALTAEAQRSLQQQIASRSVRRVYSALVAGALHPPQGLIEAPIGRDARNRLRMAVHGIAPRAAATEYSVDRRFADYSLVRAVLRTGRTHQIRVHLAAVGHPLAGDLLYGGPRLTRLERQFLHATELSFQSPSRGTLLQFNSDLPPDLEGVLASLRGQS